MTLTGRLRLLLAVSAALVALVLGAYLRAVSIGQRREQSLADLSDRLRLLSHTLTASIDDMDASAAKFEITGDARYVARFRQAATRFSSAVDSMRTAGMGADERSRRERVLDRLHRLETLSSPRSLTDSTLVAAPVLGALEELRAATGRLGDATQDEMTRQLADAAQAARRARFLSLVIGIAALAASTALFALVGSLDELDRMKRDFLSRVSHDLKTPLSSMQETVDALLDDIAGPLAPAQRRLLQLNRDSSRRLSGMLAKLLEVSRREALPPATQVTFDLTATLHRCVDRANGAEEEEPFQRPAVRCEAPLGVWIVGDEEAIAQLVDNLIENAQKFAPADSIVRVGVRILADGLTLYVADNGPGVPDADKTRIFLPFHQTAAGRSVAARGVGLGLAICHHIAREHGGTIYVEDNTPRGAVFRVDLPTVPAGSDLLPQRDTSWAGAA